MGDAIRARRLDLDISQEELARRAGLKRAYVAICERGERNVGLANLWKISAGLGVPLSELIRDLERRLG